ncbi:MAG TPA: hypothetical protein VJ183_09325 [Chloroflexia bacterium]|nr:hypothetical protein [Chloroflexia bacterium]
MDSDYEGRRLSIAQIAWWSVSTVLASGVALLATGLPASFASVNTGLLLLVVMFFIGLFGGALAGLCAGLIQFVILNGRVSWARRWIWASVCGWAVGIATLFMVFSIYQIAFFEYPKQGVSEVPFVALTSIAIIIATGAIGATQALLLHSPARVLWRWAGITAFGWLLGGAAWGGLRLIMPFVWPGTEQALNYASLPLVAAIAGIVMGVALNWLIRTVPAGKVM